LIGSREGGLWRERGRRRWMDEGSGGEEESEAEKGKGGGRM